MTAALLELRALAKNFDAAGQTLRILRGVDFALRAGETVAVTGPSGSGKSTLLGLMAGLERPSSGSVLFRGERISDWEEERLSRWRRSSVGFIFQDFRLIDSLTALENAQLPLELLGQSPRDSRTRAEEHLRALGVFDRGGHFPFQLSGGEQQRVAIARAYAHDPDVIFADEPTGSLDRATADKVLEGLLRFNAEKGAALILVTHDPAVAGRMGRALTLEGGQLA